MGKKIIGLLFLSQTLFAFDAKQIDYEQLASQSYTEHVVAFKALFELKKIDNFLEFGMGLGTKYFLDQCKHVTSIEISIESRARDIDPWYDECVASYWMYKNWQPLFHRASSIVDFYNRPLALTYWTEMQNYLPDYLDEFRSEIYAICDAVLKHHKFDLAFVDPGLFTRVDFVNALFGKVKIIAAHDMQGNIYGWPLLHEDPRYERIDYMSSFGGTTFWIDKEEKELITNLKRSLEREMTKQIE